MDLVDTVELAAKDQSSAAREADGSVLRLTLEDESATGSRQGLEGMWDAGDLQLLVYDEVWGQRTVAGIRRRRRGHASSLLSGEELSSVVSSMWHLSNLRASTDLVHEPVSAAPGTSPLVSPIRWSVGGTTPHCQREWKSGGRERIVWALSEVFLTRSRRWAGGLLLMSIGLATCSDSPLGSIDGGDGAFGCDLNQAFLRDGGVGRDGIPALTDPQFVSSLPSDETSYLLDDDRVVGFMIGDQPMAVPHNVLWWHEIVNLNQGGLKLAITFCPLTGSSLIFDRSSIGGDELGVSGLLWQNNLIMYNRSTDESLWPQMLAEASCGPDAGTNLAQHPAIDITWAGWKSLHPNTLVVARTGGLGGNWSVYPYGNYESISRFLFDDAMPPKDERRHQKERVLGIPGLDGPGVAFPFQALEDQGAFAAVETVFEGESVVVFWDTEALGAQALRPYLGGQRMTFQVTEEGIVDTDTNSRWSVDGRANHGPLEGSQLEVISESYVAFWGAWAAFHPGTELWTGE